MKAILYMGGEPTDEYLSAVAQVVGGFTIVPTRGGWVDDDHQLVDEAGSMVILFGETQTKLDLAIGALMYDAAERGEQVVGIETAEGIEWTATT